MSMNKFIRASSVVGATLCMTIAADAYAIPLAIEGFDTPQQVGKTEIGGVTASSQVSGANILGGFRDMEIESNATLPLEARLAATAGVLRFSNATAVQSTAYVTWDGDDDPTVVDPTGLGGIDITAGTATGIYVNINSTDLSGLELTFTVYDTSGNTSSLMKSYGIILSQEIDPFLYSSFIGSADFTSVGAIQLRLTGPAALDAEIDLITIGAPTTPTATPVPNTLAILIPAIGLLTLRLRRG
jgi:hypothetical protein